MNMVLTNNFYSYIRTVLLSNVSANGSMTSGSSDATSGWTNEGSKVIGILIDVNGNTVTSIMGAYSEANGTNLRGRQASLNQFQLDNSNNTMFGIGTGNTQATVNDTDLVSAITSNITYSITSIHKIENSKGVLQFYISCTNTSAAATSVNEIGLYKNVYITKNEAKKCLLGRGVFDTAQTIAPNETKTFVVEIQL